MKNEIDDIKNPAHYQISGLGDSMDIIIKVVNHNTDDIEKGIKLFNVLKYLFRFGHKDGIKDLKKAKNYLDMLIEREVNIENKPVCKTCQYYYDFEGVCVNGYSEHCADFVDEDDSCEAWELSKTQKS